MESDPANTSPIETTKDITGCANLRMSNHTTFMRGRGMESTGASQKGAQYP